MTNIYNEMSPKISRRQSTALRFPPNLKEPGPPSGKSNLQAEATRFIDRKTNLNKAQET